LIRERSEARAPMGRRPNRASASAGSGPRRLSWIVGRARPRPGRQMRAPKPKSAIGQRSSNPSSCLCANSIFGSPRSAYKRSSRRTWETLACGTGRAAICSRLRHLGVPAGTRRDGVLQGVRARSAARWSGPSTQAMRSTRPTSISSWPTPMDTRPSGADSRARRGSTRRPSARLPRPCPQPAGRA
jgi:hypothetical protein